MKLMVTLALALAGVFGFLYIIQVNSLTALAYHMGEYEMTKSRLSDNNTVLQASAIRVLSISNLEELASQMNFEKAHDISYLKTGQAAVAKTTTR